MPIKSHDWSEILDVDKRTGALIIGSRRLDDYATKYLTKRCPEVLKSPMALPVEKIIEDESLNVVEAKLSRNGDVFGCCVLLDSEIPIIDPATGNATSKFYKAGTILIDPDSECRRSVGAMRNTLIHEALHWEKDRKYFQIKAMRENTTRTDANAFLCRSSGSRRKPNAQQSAKNNFDWLEWQAHRLAPRVLMPAHTFKLKAEELLHEEPESNGITCDDLVQALSDFFIVSRESVKYRLLEVGLEHELSKLPDYESVFSDINHKDDFVALTPTEAYELIDQSSVLASWLKENHYLFVEGYFVLASHDWVMQDGVDLKLTNKAKKNLARCALNIRAYNVRSYANFKKDLDGAGFLLRSITEADQRLLAFLPADQRDLPHEPDEVYKAFADQLFDIEDDDTFQDMLTTQSVSLCECLSYLMERKGIGSAKIFMEATMLNENYFGRIKKDDYNTIGKDHLMAVCVGLKLGTRTVIKLFAKSDHNLKENEEPYKTCLKIIDKMPGLSIADFNGALVARGLPELGSKIRG